MTGSIFNDCSVANFLQSVPVEEFILKVGKYLRKLWQKLGDSWYSDVVKQAVSTDTIVDDLWVTFEGHFNISSLTVYNTM